MIWHNFSADEVISELNTNKEVGLTTDEVWKRVRLFGKNEFRDETRKSLFSYIIKEFKSFFACLLAAVTVIYWILSVVLSIGNPLDCLSVLLLLFFSALFSAIVKYASDRRNESMRNALLSDVTVIRNGKEVTVKENLLVPGDIMVLKSGDYVRADGRLIDAYVLKCDEFLVTGETVPVDKIPEAIHPDITPLPKRSNMIYRGSVVVNGKGLMVVTDTADATEIGMHNKIKRSVSNDDSAMTQKLCEIRKISNNTALVLSSAIFVFGVLVNFFSEANFAGTVTEFLLLGLAFYISTTTYAIPGILNLATTFSSFRLKSSKITVTEPGIMEKLKDISVICTDKTGILTTEDLKVVKIFNGIKTVDLNEHTCDEASSGVLRLALICSNFSHDEHTERHSNNMERAIEAACKKYIGESKTDVDGMFPRLAELPFDSQRMLMTTVSAINGSPIAIIKGAPEVVLDRCVNINHEQIGEIATEYAKCGHKVIAVAIKHLSEIPANPNCEELENELTFTGIIAFEDQLDRRSVALCRECINAGIKIVMVTGDHIDTAITIGRSLGILKHDSEAISSDAIAQMDDDELLSKVNNYSVFARVTPEDKLRIVSALKHKNENVFVTGDSINDTSAILEADIGCALGLTASDTVKDSADIVIADNKFKTIVNAIKESGRIFLNIRKSIGYIFTFGLTVASTILLCLIFFGSAALSPASVLLLSALALSMPVIAFLAEFSKSSIFIIPNKSNFFNPSFLIRFIFPSVIITVMATLGYSFTDNAQHSAQASVFAIIAFGMLAHTFSTSLSRFFISGETLTSLVAPVLCVATFIAYLILLITPLGCLVSADGISAVGWIMGLLTAIIVFVSDEALKLFTRFILKEKV